MTTLPATTARKLGLLIDLDGVVTIGGKLLSGAGAALARLHERIPYRFITNTTRRPRRRVVADLAAPTRGAQLERQQRAVDLEQAQRAG